MNIAAVDIIFLILAFVIIVRCIFRGFVADIFSFLSIVGGILAAFIFDSAVAEIISSLFGPGRWNGIIAFLLIFVIFYLIVKIFENALHRIMDKLRLEKLDRALGLFLGVVEAAVVLIMIIYLLDFLPFAVIHEALEESRIAAFINGLFSWVPGRLEHSLEMII